jgi:hypothetical protein
MISSQNTSSRQRVLQVAVKREELLKLQERTQIPVITERYGQHFKHELTEIKNSAR